MKIAIVNDMPMAAEGLRRVVESTGLHQIAWTAFSGKQAVENCITDLPDLVLMDIIMPGMNGVETTREIMRVSPCPILIVTSSVSKNSALVFEAMGYGALDAVNTPVIIDNALDTAPDSLLKKISILNILTQSKLVGRPLSVQVGTSGKLPSSGPSLVTIGSSSGGPQALATILKSLPSDFSSSVIIVQHVDVQFASGLARWLDTQSKLPVRVVRDGDRPISGEVLIAGSDDHLVLTKNGELRYTAMPKDTPYRPSVDVFWNSLNLHWQGDLTAVLLTGMGKDGAKSMLDLRQKGAYTIAQNEKTCAVYGMPKAAVDIHAATKIAAIDDIADMLLVNQHQKNITVR